MVTRRILIVFMVLALPAILTALLYELSIFLLSVTQRIIDPDTLRLVTIGEFALFTFGALLEARSRWPHSDHS